MHLSKLCCKYLTIAREREIESRDLLIAIPITFIKLSFKGVLSNIAVKLTTRVNGVGLCDFSVI